MGFKIVKTKYIEIPDSLTIDQHRAVSDYIREGHVDGLMLSTFSRNSVGCSNKKRFLTDWDREKVHNLDFLHHYNNLTTLDIGLERVKSIEPILRFTKSLKYFGFSGDKNNKIPLSPIAQCQEIKHLRLHKVKKNFSSLVSLKNLITLKLGVYQQSQYEIISEFSLLESLCMYFGSLEILPELSKLSNLKNLDILNLRGLCDIQAIEDLDSLQYLKIERQKQITNLPNLSKLKNISIVILATLNGLDDISGLANCQVEELGIIHTIIKPIQFKKLLDKLPRLEGIIIALKTKKDTMEAESFFDTDLVYKNTGGLKKYTKIEVDNAKAIEVLNYYDVMK